VLVICLSLDFPADSPSLGIDSIEGLQVLVQVLEQKVNKTCDYESKRKLEVSVVAKLHCVELQMGDVDGCMHLVKCKICLEVEHKDNLLVLNGIHSINTLVKGMLEKI
jgi:hypothetical protein